MSVIPGCVLCLIQRDRFSSIKEECNMDSDELMMLALDAGAEMILMMKMKDAFEILTNPDDCGTVREALEKAGLKLIRLK